MAKKRWTLGKKWNEILKTLHWTSEVVKGIKIVALLRTWGLKLRKNFTLPEKFGFGTNFSTKVDGIWYKQP